MRGSPTRREWFGLVAGMATLSSASACTREPEASRDQDRQPPSGLLEAEASSPWRGKPPHGGYAVDLRMRNPSAEARWLIFPQTLFQRVDEGAEHFVNKHLISLELMDSRSDAQAFILSSYADFWAFRAAPQAEIGIRSITLYSGFDVASAPQSVVLELLVANALRIDGEPVEDIFPRLREPWGDGWVASPYSHGPVERWNQGERAGAVRVAIESTSRRRMKLPRWKT